MTMRFGRSLVIELHGSSHGPVVGVTVNGLPTGTPVDPVRIQADLDRRKPVGRRLATKRQEEDRLVVESGVRDGRTDGAPIRAHVANEDVRRGPYEQNRTVPRPGHADYPARIRYGEKADLSGGGIFSGRMTVGLVIAGALVRPLLDRLGIEVAAFTRSVDSVHAVVATGTPIADLARAASRNEVGCPDPDAAARMEEAILAARKGGDSLGGVIECRADGAPVGLGEPFFDSLEATIAHLAFSIPAVKGVEFGAGFEAATMKGSEHNDPFYIDGDRVRTRTNHAGGILGGLATGETLVARVAVKPTSSIARPQESVDLATHRSTTVVVSGRHDPCIVPRAVVVVESAMRFALADLALTGGFL